jgi:hypothetical protein
MGHSVRPDKAAQRANDAGSIGDRTPRGEFKSKLSGVPRSVRRWYHNSFKRTVDVKPHSNIQS